MTLMLLDSASLWYRAYFGMPDTLVSPSGMPVNAIRGFLDMTSRLVVKYQPNRLVACLEGDWRPSWRVELFPAYKLNRLDEEGGRMNRTLFHLKFLSCLKFLMPLACLY